MISNTFDKLLDSALSLSVDDRIKLAHALMATHDPEDSEPLDAEWIAEIKRRSAELHAGTVKTYSWEEVKRIARSTPS